MDGSTLEQVAHRLRDVDASREASEREIAQLQARCSQLKSECAEPIAEQTVLKNELFRMTRRPPAQYRKTGLAGFFAPGLNEAGKLRMAELKAKLETLGTRLSDPIREIAEINHALTKHQSSIGYKLAEARLCREKIEALKALEKRQDALNKRKQKQKERTAALRAAAASANGKGRKLAATVRKHLQTQQDCPYCGGVLGDSPHADHIYPMALGGQSTVWNMVLVCAECNIKKAAMTLGEFIAVFQLDEHSIKGRLQSLGKRF